MGFVSTTSKSRRLQKQLASQCLFSSQLGRVFLSLVLYLVGSKDRPLIRLLPLSLVTLLFCLCGFLYPSSFLSNMKSSKSPLLAFALICSSVSASPIIGGQNATMVLENRGTLPRQTLSCLKLTSWKPHQQSSRQLSWRTCNSSLNTQQQHTATLTPTSLVQQ